MAQALGNAGRHVLGVVGGDAIGVFPVDLRGGFFGFDSGLSHGDSSPAALSEQTYCLHLDRSGHSRGCGACQGIACRPALPILMCGDICAI